MSRSKYGRRLGLAICGTVLGLLACELGVRAWLSVQAARQAAAWRNLGAPTRSDGPVELGNMVRPHAERRISYELIPDLDVIFKGAPVRTNTNGFRGPARATTPAPGTTRVVGLGDSVMFGWGVDYEESFLPVLERKLIERFPGAALETVNTAVPGYNTVMEVETLERKGLAYEPDLVVIDHVGNDLLPPHFIPLEIDYWTPSRSFLLALLEDELRGEDRVRFRPFGRPPQLATNPSVFRSTLEFDPEVVPPGLRDMVGLESYRAAMRRLSELSDEHGFRVLVTSHDRAPDYVHELCAELGFALVETGPGLERYMAEHGIEGRVGSVLTLSADDPHPTPLAHGLQVEAILSDPAAAALFQELLGERSSG